MHFSLIRFFGFLTLLNTFYEILYFIIPFLSCLTYLPFWDFSWIRSSFLVFHLQTGLTLFIDLFIDCMIIFNTFPRDENFSPVCSCSNLGEIWSRFSVTAVLLLHCFHLLCAISNKLAFCTINIMYHKTHFHLSFSIQNNRF